MKNRLLKNGLKIVAVENPSTEVVTVQIWLKCGSVLEKDGEYGLSHFIEHLVFKGSRNYGVGEIAHSVEKLGGEINAFTSSEYTCFYITLPVMYLKEALVTLKDLVFYPSFVTEEIEREREVVLEEIKRSKDLPDRNVITNLLKDHFEGHAYSRPVLGFDNVISSVTPEKIKDYYSRFYRTTNAILIIAGSDKEKKMLDLGGEIFNELNKQNTVQVHISDAKPKTKYTYALEQMDVKELNISMAFPIPGLLHEHIPTMDVLALLFGQGESSRLYQRIRQELGLVTTIYASSYTPKLGGGFILGFTMESSKNEIEKLIEKVIFEIAEELKTVMEHGFSNDEIDKAKTVLLSEKVYERETVENYGRKIGYLLSVTGKLDFDEIYAERLKRVNNKTIRDMITHYIKPDRMTVSAVLPKEIKINESMFKKTVIRAFSGVGGVKTTRIKSQVKDNSSSRAAKISKVSSTFSGMEFSIGASELINYKSGAKLILRKNTSTPLAAIRIIFPGGARFENDNNQGVFNLLARNWLYGADKLSHVELVQNIEGCAATLEPFSGRNSIGINIEAIKPFTQDLLDLGTKVLLAPKFNSELFDIEKKLVVDEVKSMQDNLAYYTGVLLLKTIYKIHPYKYELTGTLDTLGKLSRKDIINIYKKFIVSNNMIVSVVGDFEKKQIVKWFEHLNDNLPKSKAADKVNILQEPEQTEARVARFKKESKQAHIALAFKTCDFKSGDRAVLKLISSILAGQSGRLFLNLRDKMSLAYTVSPILMEGPDAGYFGLYIAGDPSKVEISLELMRKELYELRTNMVKEEELLRAKNYILGRYVLNHQRFGEQAGTMAFDELYGVGYDAISKYQEEIMEVTGKDILDIANKYFKDDRENLAIVSN
jgi:zinc protease